MPDHGGLFRQPKVEPDRRNEECRLPPDASSDDSKRQSSFVTVIEFVEISGISIATVNRYLRSRKLPFCQPNGPGGLRLIPRDALEQLMAVKVSSAPSHESPEESPDGTAAAEQLPGPCPRWRNEI